MRRFATHDLNDHNIADLLVDIARGIRHEGRIEAITDEEAGGIVAYTLGNTEELASLLNRAAYEKEETP